jgi:hypothetical protein
MRVVSFSMPTMPLVPCWDDRKCRSALRHRSLIPQGEPLERSSDRKVEGDLFNEPY